MARFSPKRAEAFAAYTITALVRDAVAKGKTFIRMSRQQVAEALEMERLHPPHIETVREHLLKYGYAMADLGTEFMFFEADQTASTILPHSRLVNHATNAFARVLGSDAADEMWNDGTYKPPVRERERPKPVLTVVRKPIIRTRETEDAPIRVRG